MIRVSPFPEKSSTVRPAPPYSITSIWGKSNRLQKLSLCFCAPPSPLHLFSALHLFNCIFLILAHPPPPSVPLFLCPSFALPGACLSGSVPVCLFADDSTWSRCDAQQLLLCSAASPHPPPFISLFASPPVSLMFLFICMPFCSLPRRCSVVNWRV